MPDNLTKQFMDDLLKKQKQGVMTQVQPLVSQKRSLGENPSLYEQLLGDVLVDLDVPDEPEKASGVLHGVGSALWHFVDSALVGIPGIGVKAATGEKPYSLLEGKTEGLATVGGVIGEAAGFLVPIKWVGMGVRAGVSAVTKAGTSNLVGKAVKEAGDVAVRSEIGLSREIAERAVSTALKEPQVMKKFILPKYELSLDEVSKVKDVVRGSIYESLKREFPDATDDILKTVGDEATRALTTEGVHINNLGRLIEKGLNAKFGVAEKSNITKYVARAAEMGTSFAIYNLIYDGVHSLAGEKEFDPVADVKDAFIFAAFLPAVEMVGGGGKVHIRKTATNLRKTLNNITKGSSNNYKGLNEEQVNGLLKIISRDNYLKDTIIGKEAGNWAYKNLPREEAVDALKRVVGLVDVPTVWKDFYKYAGEDFIASLGRMTLGALYFNMHTIMDTNLLKALPPEEIMAHLLVGAWFTKLKKPLFIEKHPHLNKFEERSLALQYLGMNPENISHYAKAFDNQMHLGAAFSGLLANPVVNRIENIFSSEELRKQQEGGQWGEPVGLKENIPTRLNLVRWAHNLYEYSALSRNIDEPNLLERVIKLDNLTVTQLEEIQSKLESIEIKEGVKLSEDNFHDFATEAQKGALEGTGKLYAELMVRIAKRIGLETDHELGNEIDIDTPIRMARLPDISQYIGNAEYQEIILAHRIRDTLDEQTNLIQTIKQTPGEELKVSDIDNSPELKHDIKKEIDAVMDRLRVENYGTNYPENIDPIENSFLLALSSYRQTSNREAMFNMVDGKLDNLSDKQKILWEILDVNFGESVPKNLMNLVGTIDLKKPEKMKDDEWDKIIDNRIELSRKITYLAKMWGEGKVTGDLKMMDKAGRVEYEEAKDIVGQFEKEGFVLDRDTTEIQRRYFYSRIMSSPNITSKHLTMIDGLMAHEVGRVEKENGRNVLKIWNVESVRAALTDLYGGTDNQHEIEPLVKKYKDVYDSLHAVKGKFVDVQDGIPLKQVENLPLAIEDAWMVSSHFDKQVLVHYEDAKKSVDMSLGFLDSVDGLFESLYDKNELGERTTIKSIDNAEQSDAIVARVEGIIEKYKNDPLVGEENIKPLELLIKRVIDGETLEKVMAGVDSAAKVIEKTLADSRGESLALDSVLETIRFDLMNYSSDRIMGKRRLDRLTARLTEILRTELNVDVPEDLSLREIAGKFAAAGNLRKLVDHMDVSVRNWRKGIDEESYFEQEAKIAEQWNDYSTNNMPHMPDVSPATISQRYGRYNEWLKGKEWQNLLTELDERRGLFLQNPTPKGEKALKANRNRIREEIRNAIYAKHMQLGEDIEYGTKYEKLPDHIKKEIDDFNKYTWPALMAISIGRVSVPSASLSYDKNGKPILEIGRSNAGTGLTSEIIEELRGEGVSVVTLDMTGVYRGRKTNVNTIEDIDNVIEQAKPQDSISKNLTDVFRLEDAQERQEATTQSEVEVFSKPVRVPVSYNTSLIVGIGELTDGRLNKWFDSWYNDKVSFLDSIAADRNRTNVDREKARMASRHIKVIYGDFGGERAPTSSDVKQMVRAVYWDKVSNTMVNDMLASAANSGELNNQAASLFKYVTLAEGTGAKTRASEQFYKEMKEDAVFSLNGEQIAAIDAYLKEGAFNIVGLGDELSGSGLNAKFLAKRKLDQLKGQNIPGRADQEAALDKLLASIDSSASNAQSYMGTNAAHLIYLPKGRRLDDFEMPFGTAGAKPYGWFNEPGESILLKSNFVYNRKIAETLDDLGIDILTTQSAAKAFNADFVEVTEKMIKDNNINTMEGAVKLALQNVTGFNKGRMKLENIFLGKVEDRKALTSVTYGLTDFLPTLGYKSFMNDYVGYENRITQELGKLASLHIGQGRIATADYLMRVLRDENALFEESSNGLISAYLEVGADPSSILMRESIRRIAVRNIVNSLRKPKVDGASHSILVPFLEGSIPVYKDGRQTIIGGKKLSHFDGMAEIKDFRKVQYVVEVSLPTMVSRDNVRRDVQIGRDKDGKWIVQDPLDTLTAKELDSQIKRIESLERSIKGRKRLRYMHERLSRFNESQDSKDMDSKFYLHSLSLRMPNLGGDVAVHKVEGFYDRAEGNVVGVNIHDIAQTHQADFDVDPVFSYNVKPTEVANDIFKFAGHSIDAYVYESEGPVINPFGTTNSELGRAGSAYPKGDSINKHIQLNMQAKDSFGRIKRLSSSLSAILRAGKDEINFGADVSMIDIAGTEGRLRLGGFLQRYKNVLQSLIDSVKKPNFASQASHRDLMKFILFDGKLEGDEKLRADLGKYGEEGYEQFFRIKGEKTGYEKDVLEDIVMESLTKLSQSQRFLTDVFDAGGRRPPEANEIAYMRSSLHRFTTNPNLEIYHSLLSRYSGRKKQKELVTALNKLYFLSSEGDDFREWQHLKKNYRKVRKGEPAKSIVYIKNPQTIKDSNVGNYIVSRFGQSDSDLRGYSRSIERGKAKLSARKVSDILDEIDVISSLSDSKTHEKIRDMIEENDNIVTRQLSEYVLKDISKLSTVNDRVIEDYSLLFHSLREEKGSIQRYISKAGRHQSNSITRARRKLMHIDALLDYLTQKESDLVQHIKGKPADEKNPLTKHFDIRTKNTKKKKGYVKFDNPYPKGRAFVYRRFRDRNGRLKFIRKGYIEPLGSFRFEAGHEYVILRNPIRNSAWSNESSIDAYAMLEVVGDLQVEHILPHSPEATKNKFVAESEQLKHNLGSLASQVYKLAERNPHQVENWQFERLMEDSLVDDFMKRWLRSADNQWGEQDRDITYNETMSSLVRYLIKPEPVFRAAFIANTNLKMPAYRINKRLTNAVSRWMLREMHSEEFESIFGSYGRVYRRKMDNVIPDEFAELWQSRLYFNDNYWLREKSPVFELAFEKGWLYMPAMQHHLRHELSRYHDRARTKMDASGEMDVIMQYGTYNDILNDMKYYRDSRNYMSSEDKSPWECG